MHFQQLQFLPLLPPGLLTAVGGRENRLWMHGMGVLFPRSAIVASEGLLWIVNIPEANQLETTLKLFHLPIGSLDKTGGWLIACLLWITQFAGL